MTGFIEEMATMLRSYELDELLDGNLFRRSLSKSVFTWPATSKLTGNELAGFVVGRTTELLAMDEFFGRAPQPRVYDGELLAKFEDPAWPDLTTFASILRVERRDPRHPNPAAGSLSSFFVTSTGYKLQVKNRTTAIAKAERLHKRLVRDAIEAVAKAEADRIAELERNASAAGLTYGGF